MDIIRFLDDYSIPYSTEGSKHNQEGYVNLPCPFCSGNEGHHLGYNLDENFWNCWRCGWHSPLKVLHTLTNIPYHELKELVPAYGGNRSRVLKRDKNKKAFKLPTGLTELTKGHKKYLRRRGFDPFILETVWGVKSLSPISSLDGADYSHRVFIPYMWNSQMVSFDTRDVTGKQENKYKAIPLDYEILPRKEILFGNMEAWGKTGVIVEGAFDVFSLGELAAATSGIKYKAEQVRVIARSFKKVGVVFDGEPQAQKAAKNLVSELRFRGINAMNFTLNGDNDPGDLNRKEAKDLVNHIKRKLR